MGIVIGGGNIFRGAAAKSMDRVSADYVGMLCYSYKFTCTSGCS